MEKIQANKAPITPKITPVIYSNFTAFTIKYIPGIINKPSAISAILNFDFVIIGSKIEVKKVVVEKVIRAIETLEYLIEPKKQTQWMATKKPINIRCLINLVSTFLIAVRIVFIKNKKLSEVKNIRHQTKGNSFKEINFPKIPVNPNRKTVKCNSKYAFFVSSKILKLIKFKIIW